MGYISDDYKNYNQRMDLQFNISNLLLLVRNGYMIVA